MRKARVADGVLAIHTVLVVLIPVLSLWCTYTRTDRWQFSLFVALVTSCWVQGHCLLTRWEQSLRAGNDPARDYTGSCIAHYAQHWFGLTVTNFQFGY